MQLMPSLTQPATYLQSPSAVPGMLIRTRVGERKEKEGRQRREREWDKERVAGKIGTKYMDYRTRGANNGSGEN